MQIDIRSAAAGGIIALAFGALAAFQAPQLVATPDVSVRGIPEARDLWRWTTEDQAANGNAGYVVPDDKVLVVCGVGKLPWVQTSNNWTQNNNPALLTVDGNPFLAAQLGSGEGGNQHSAYLPGLRVNPGQVLRFEPPYTDGTAYSKYVFVHGYLQDAQ